MPLTLDSINIAQSKECLIRHGQYISASSAEVNSLTPNMLKDGMEIDDAMSLLFTELSGKVVLCHSASIEKAFILAFLESHYGVFSLPAYFVDTLAIEKKYSYLGKTRSHYSFQLDDLRAHYGLPSYHSHSAASDALACAELFLFQYQKLIRSRDIAFSELCEC